MVPAAALFNKGQRVRRDLRKRNEQFGEPEDAGGHVESASDRRGLPSFDVFNGGLTMAPNQLPLNRKLVVHQWMLSLFGVKSFEELRNILRHDSLEGLDED